MRFIPMRHDFISGHDIHTHPHIPSHKGNLDLTRPTYQHAFLEVGRNRRAPRTWAQREHEKLCPFTATWPITGRNDMESTIYTRFLVF